MAGNAVAEAAPAASAGRSGAPALIVVACTGNRGRSPAVEGMLKSRIAAAGLTGSVEVTSGGLCAHELGRVGMTADPMMIEACAEFDVDISAHIVRPLTPELVNPAALVIVMERWQAQVVRRGYKAFAGQVHTLPQLGGAGPDVEIEDPAGYVGEQLRQVLLQAQQYLESGLESGPLKTILDSARRREP